MKTVTLLRVLGAVVILFLIWMVWGWSPDAQVLNKTRALLEAASERKWDKVGRMISADYRDDWGFDKASLLGVATESGRHFLVLDIRAEGRPGVRKGRDGRVIWSGRLRFTGRGDVFGEAMLSRASSLQENFDFAWRKESWKPWDWKLVFVGQPELRIDFEWVD